MVSEKLEPRVSQLVLDPEVQQGICFNLSANESCWRMAQRGVCGIELQGLEAGGREGLNICFSSEVPVFFDHLSYAVPFLNVPKSHCLWALARRLLVLELCHIEGPWDCWVKVGPWIFL